MKDFSVRESKMLSFNFLGRLFFHIESPPCKCILIVKKGDIKKRSISKLYAFSWCISEALAILSDTNIIHFM
jgi:hypothetical protein